MAAVERADSGVERLVGQTAEPQSADVQAVPAQPQSADVETAAADPQTTAAPDIGMETAAPDAGTETASAADAGMEAATPAARVEAAATTAAADMHAAATTPAAAKCRLCGKWGRDGHRRRQQDRSNPLAAVCHRYLPGVI
jgi:hypothetical protein